MKILKRYEGPLNIVGYKSGFVVYGFMRNKKSRSYSIEIVLPFLKGAICKLYKGKSKPVLHHLPILNIISFPIIVGYLLLGAMAGCLLVIISYPYETLVSGTFLSSKFEFITGWIWIAFALYGMYSLIF